jgi:DNA polymerase III delta prime subunit
MLDDFLWVEKYRPKVVKDCVLPKDTKTTLEEFITQDDVPNLILTGGPGVGKTTAAKAMLNELGCTTIVINGSMNGNIDTLRTEIKNFASTISFDGKRKYVILDEADYLNPQSTQPALRNFMEEYSKNCGFILTCNYINRIIDPLQSRCSVIDFTIPKEHKQQQAADFFTRTCDILDKESVKYDKKVVAEVVKKYFPDFRRTLNELQRYSANGSIDTGILSSFTDKNIERLIETLKTKNFTAMRKWVGQNMDHEPARIMRQVWENSIDTMDPTSIPQLVVTLADYQYKAAFVADQEVNLVACLAEIMINCEYK